MASRILPISERTPPPTDALAALGLLNAFALRVTAARGISWSDPAQAALVFGVAPSTLDELAEAFDGPSVRVREIASRASASSGAPYRTLVRTRGGMLLEERRGPGSVTEAVIVFRPLMGDAPALGADDEDLEQLSAALGEGRAFVALQPIVDAQTRAVARYECLLRLRARDGATLAPARFVEAAERAGMAGTLDLAALDLGLAAQSIVNAPVAVNVSGGTLADQAATDAFLSRVQAAGSAVARNLTVEITETFALNDFTRCRAFADDLRSLGARLALDDFGAGYTSLRTLRTLSLDEVKIDGSYVRDVAVRGDQQLFVRALRDLAFGLGLSTVAEHVADPADAAHLRAIGVDHLQGYLFGAPQAVAA